ncbi:nitrilase-related carbon-nitrogen hydrolase [Blastococcus saxobsidens]|uniref:Putative amidohydrolase n=1 Tax=Blastococcus saxobsidens TaxID=138336 RepID=A0A4Q7YD43_9ACTN|nr:nitrilase-related carbon-nitrogen hydrolase [Blastococcus saxobsidens]RZU34169.1 putative amidohydrolase [Blastococcus saxobsidens]
MDRHPVVAALQLVAGRGDKEANLEAIEELTAAAARDGAVVVVAPEMAVTGYCWPDEDEVRALAEPLGGPAVQRLTALARRTGVWVVAGLPEVDADLGTLHNSCVLVGPEGLQGAYRKIHPFLADPFWAVDGNAVPPVWNTPAGRVSPMICADLDYPEMARFAALAGADWAAVPTAWVDEPGPSATWRLRAWENALPMVVADMAGAELGVQFSGGSAVLDHRGGVLSSRDAGPGHVVATLDLDAAARARTELLGRRRPAEYRPLALSRRWPRRSVDSLFGAAPTEDRVVTAVLSAVPGKVPVIPEGVGLAVLPAFHLCGGAPQGRAAAEAAAVAWPAALQRLRELAAAGACEVVTSLVEAGDGGVLHHTVVAVAPDGEPVRHRVTHLGRHASWATPGAGSDRPVPRPWGRLALLAGEELEAFEPSRVLAVHDADVIAVPAAVDWPWPVAFAGSEVPLGAELQAPDPCFAHPARLRAGDSHVWIALANAEPAGPGHGVPGGVFAPDHVRVPRAEVLARAEGWTVLGCATRAPDDLGRTCEDKPQLVRRRTDLLAGALLTSRA